MPSTPDTATGEAAASDWSAVGVEGRELRTAVTVRVAAGQRGRLPELAAAAERAGAALAGEIDGWRIGGATLLRSRPVREKGGEPAVLVEHRVRVAREN